MHLYLDHNATTPVDPRVLEAMLPYLKSDFGNPSSLHWAGARARKALEEAREKVAHGLLAAPEDVIFTSGGTESINLAIKGTVRRLLKDRGGPVHIITSKIEHQAVLQTVADLESTGQIEVSRVDVTPQGEILPEEVKRAIKDNTVLISIQFVNNEIGTIAPVEEIGKLARERGIVFHTDAVQAVGKLKVRFDGLPVDLLSFSGHKICGPKGVGALVARRGTRFLPLIHGGPQEWEKRGGTENLPGIVGLGEAIRISSADLEKDSTHMSQLRDYLEESILMRIPAVIIHGNKKNRVCNTLNIRFKDISGESLVIALDQEGIAVSSGSACASGAIGPSHVLLAMGLSKSEAKGAIRFSLGKGTTKEEIENVLEILSGIYERLR